MAEFGLELRMWTKVLDGIGDFGRKKTPSWTTRMSRPCTRHA